MGFSLTILVGPEAGKTYKFDRVEITIGRTMENDVVLPDPSISRQHIHIRDKGGAFIAKDLGSSNGTRLNGKLIKEEVLRPGDMLELGKARIRFDGEQRKSVQSRITERKEVRAGPSHARPPQASAKAAAKAAQSAPPANVARSPGPVIRSSGLRTPAPTNVAAPAAGAEKGRPATALKALFRAGMERFSRLDKRLRLAIIALAGFLLLLLAIKAFKGGRDIVRKMSDHSDEIFDVGTLGSDNEPASFGLGDVTYRCREKVSFRFKYASGRAVAVFLVGGIDKRNELTVKLNDMAVFNIPEPWAVDKWSDVVYRKLDRKHLLENEENKLTFVNNVNSVDPAATEKWGVQLLAIEETPLPAPDQNAARENFELGKKRYERKDVAPENLYHALQNFEKTRDYLELLPEGAIPDIYAEACEMIDKITGELDERFKAWMFDASRAVKYGRYKDAIEIIRRLLKAFPDQEDPRHQAAREKLAEFE